MTESINCEKISLLQKPKQSAILVPVYRRDDGEVVIILVRRTEGDLHGGQIAFPGGKISKSDKTLLDTALREADEEIGLPAENVQIIRQLPIVYTNSSNFEITPFLGKIKRPANWKLSKNEISEVIETPVKTLTDPVLHGRETMNFPHWPAPKEVPFIRVGQYKLWGATYRILNPIMEDIVNDIFSI